MAEIIYFIITIGILVFVHEFGHFAAAKLSKMRVDVFAIGFGYRLFGYNKKSGFSFGKLPKDFDTEGNTDYRLSLLPLGGYVKIAGMVDESMDTKFTESEPQPYEFRAKSVPKKVFVITAGVLMNLLLTLLIFWGVKFFLGDQLVKTTTVGYIAADSPADSAGFMTNDKILSINGNEVTYWQDIRNQIYLEHRTEDLTVDVDRNGTVTTLNVPRSLIPAINNEDLFLSPRGLRPEFTTIGKIPPGSFADSAGFRTADEILTVNGQQVIYWDQVIDELYASPSNDTISITVNRNGSEEHFRFASMLLPPEEESDLFLLPDGPRPLIAAVMSDYPADTAGVQLKDELLTINGEQVYSSQQATRLISASTGSTAEIKVLRGADTVTIAVAANDEGKIGVMIGYLQQPQFEVENVTYGFFAAFGQGVDDIVRITELTFSALGGVIGGNENFGDNFGGPIKIAKIAAEHADSGMISFLKFLAMLSLSLAIINIMPFPVLDGGHLIIILIEGALKRELSMKVKIAVQNTGFVILLLLMAFIIYQDILSL